MDQKKKLEMTKFEKTTAQHKKLLRIFSRVNNIV